MPAMARYVVGALLVLATTLRSFSAFAQSFPAEPAHLEYERLPGAEACPDEEAFRQEVEMAPRTSEKDFLPPDPYDSDAVVVRVTVERAGSGSAGRSCRFSPRAP